MDFADRSIIRVNLFYNASASAGKNHFAMKANYQNASMLDMIFEHRNKAYGAYALRNHYNRRISLALLITFSFIFLLGGGKFLLDHMNSPQKNVMEHIVIVEPIPEIHLEDQPEIRPELPPETQPQAIQTERNVEMNVVQDNQAPADSIPTVAELRDAESGAASKVGKTPHRPTPTPPRLRGLPSGRGTPRSRRACGLAS